MLQMNVARELGCTLAQLTANATFEEMVLWDTYFQIKHEDAEREFKRRKR
jgi:hypothetical protein